MSEYYLIAGIKALNGDDGFVTVHSVSDDPLRIKELQKVYIDIFGSYKEFYPESFRTVRNTLCVKFRNFDTSAEAEILVGKNIYADKVDLTGLLDNTYYIHDLLDSRVLRNGQPFGILKDVWNLPANDVYVIIDIQGKEVLIPAIKDYIESFDPDKKILVLKPGDTIYDDDED